MRVLKWFCLLMVVASLTEVKVNAQTKTTGQTQDQIFSALRNAGLNNDTATADRLAAQLTDYKIPSYVEYYRIRPHLQQVDTADAEVRAFLDKYAGTAIADRLRNDWLLALGKAGSWDTFDVQFPQFVLQDDAQVKCYALISRVNKGQNVADDARVVLSQPRNYGNGCTDLISLLVQKQQFNEDDIQMQLQMMSEWGVRDPLQRVANSLPSLNSKKIMQAYDRPDQLLADKTLNMKNWGDYQAVLIALGRLSRTDTPKAISYLSKFSDKLNRKENAQAWTQIAFIASRQLDPDALDYWKKASSTLSEEGYQWRVRAALRANDWDKVKLYINEMPEYLKKDSAWIYWWGRAEAANGNDKNARKAYQTIQDDHGFYAQLAQEELGSQTTVPPAPAPVADQDVDKMGQNAGLQRAVTFYNMDMFFEAMREWNWEIRKLKTDQELLAASEFARQNNMLDRMLSTSIRTKNVVDFTQRFPAPHLSTMYATTKTLDVEVAWIYGLIRQESRFMKDVQSSVGASGLMQLMPGTAKFVANKIGLKTFKPSEVNDVNTNLMLGSNYLNMMLDGFEHSQVLVTAAYNAGPSRAKIWWRQIKTPMDAAIFAETIPFTETRGYVKNVMSNATYYAALFDGKPQSLKQRLGTITPNSAGQ